MKWNKFYETDKQRFFVSDNNLWRKTEMTDIEKVIITFTSFQVGDTSVSVSGIGKNENEAFLNFVDELEKITKRIAVVEHDVFGMAYCNNIMCHWQLDCKRHKECGGADSGEFVWGVGLKALYSNKEKCPFFIPLKDKNKNTEED